MRIVVVDDEPLAREELVFLLKECGYANVVGQAADVSEAMPLIIQEKPDVVFTDLRMLGPDGIVLADLVRTRLPNVRVVIISAHDDAAMRAFESHVFDYLLKPVKLDRLRDTLSRLEETLRIETTASSPARPIEQIAVKDGDSYRVIALRDVVCFEVKDLFVWAVTAAGKFALDQSLSAVEAQLDAKEFFRSHRGVIVRLSRLQRMEPSGAGTYDLVLNLDPEGRGEAAWEHRVPLARDRVKMLRQRITFS